MNNFYLSLNLFTFIKKQFMSNNDIIQSIYNSAIAHFDGDNNSWILSFKENDQHYLNIKHLIETCAITTAINIMDGNDIILMLTNEELVLNKILTVSEATRYYKLNIKEEDDNYFKLVFSRINKKSVDQVIIKRNINTILNNKYDILSIL